MGSIWSTLAGFKRYLKTPGYRVLFLGLDYAGKTTIPTIGFSVETIQFKKTNITVWDLEKIRPLWRHYFESTDGVVFIIDASDRTRIQEALSECGEIVLDSIDLDHAPICFFLNKQDLPSSVSKEEFIKDFAEDAIDYEQSEMFHVQETSAVSGTGLMKGLDWLFDAMKRFSSPSLTRMGESERESYRKLKQIWNFGWRPETHMFFPKRFRRIVWHVLLISQKGDIHLPLEIMLLILSFVKVSRCRMERIQPLLKRVREEEKIGGKYSE